MDRITELLELLELLICGSAFTLLRTDKFAETAELRICGFADLLDLRVCGFAGLRIRLHFVTDGQVCWNC